MAYGEIALLFSLADASGKQPTELYNARMNDRLGWNARISLAGRGRA